MSRIRWSRITGVFCAGVGAGAVIALLLAPKSGEDARAYLSDTVRKGIDGATAQGSKLARLGKEVAGQVKERTKDFVSQAGEARDDAYHQAKDAVS